MSTAADGEGFELVRLASGVCSLRSLRNGEVFHPVIGPAAEAEAIHVGGAGLVERARRETTGGHPFVIWDVGLGAGANALVALTALLAATPIAPGVRVELCSFDLSTDALRFACEHSAALDYPRGFEQQMAQLIARKGVWVRPADEADARRGFALRWSLHEGEFPAVCDATELLAPHAIFYDPYSPSANPEMWTCSLFERLHRRLDPGRPCFLTNYSRSTAVRVTLLLAGWFVGVGAATGEKEETTVAANALSLLSRPLDERWLEKTVRASANAAPLRNPVAPAGGKISAADYEQLRQHRQFA